jgi:hypothetical protein
MNANQSPDYDETEQAIRDAEADQAPRVTHELIESRIVKETFFTAAEGAGPGYPKDGPLNLLTFCVLTLDNDFTVTGQSKCVSAANFDKDIGQTLARKDAVEQIWQLEGYLLAERLCNSSALERLRDEYSIALKIASNFMMATMKDGLDEEQGAKFMEALHKVLLAAIRHVDGVDARMSIDQDTMDAIIKAQEVLFAGEQPIAH